MSKEAKELKLSDLLGFRIKDISKEGDLLKIILENSFSINIIGNVLISVKREDL